MSSLMWQHLVDPLIVIWLYLPCIGMLYIFVITNLKCFPFHRCKWAKIHTEEHRISSGVIIEVAHDEPVVGIIQDLYIFNGEILTFYVECFHTSYESHYRPYVLDKHSFSSKLISHSSLFIRNSIHVHTSCVPCFVILPYALCDLVWFIFVNI